ncbi:phospholipid/cholesterol/gamma-HCH transport system substrate-binding protein [Nocardioides albertanoniae]|uniref:Phospholipid/cholesterol/gamma-HCH transport system substrate-binding protein n=1 Tax=Nocardioides albertanoniae TaxID=1175486 RepID=A0A543A2J7_9ACTN|nr:MCE family protein [Nocardioides albertanoniae]TQL66817.1 phospholipid/cholesterol/gamma-HCH transport system substrate-binding protein [Nocardioides albertanoniae]
MARYPKTFAERNKVVLALVGIAAMSLTFFATFHADDLPIVGGGRTYQAYFAEAGGIRAGDEARVAGVKVGEVTGIELSKDKVLVSFRAKDVSLGGQTTASIKVKTLLGRKFLALDPGGSGRLSDPIPLSRTTTPYDVNAAFSDLSTTVDEIDMDQVEESMDALSTTFKDTPEDVRGMVSGLTRLSRTVSSRDQELAELMRTTSKVTGTLADRNDEIGLLIEDGDKLLDELAARRESIHQMLTHTDDLAKQVKGLIADNQKRLRPALEKLDQVAKVLQRNQDHLDKALSQIGAYYRVIGASMSNGPWIDVYGCGLFDKDQAPVLDNDVNRDCRPGAKK